MGKKGKIGKSRKDKFYHLAKETGYRARSAFKLLQLNRKFEFLQRSRVVIDLCAAPGGWLQVAAQHMPISSLIIGVDLVPIKTIHNVKTFQADITTDKCKQLLRKELQTWDADVFLNDGAPNVGKNWIHDAFAQAELTLAALKLATQFLRKGGWFVTKVFRSKDYGALITTFGELFQRVHATKPKASRNESAEIFVVCSGYKKPAKLDPKLLDPKFVFKELDEDDDKKAMNIFKPQKAKKKADGYEDGDYLQHHKLGIKDFLEADNHLQLLADTNEIMIDNEEILNHPSTTEEIKQCCKDIKVLGKKDIRGLLAWRKRLKNEMSVADDSDKCVEEEEEESEDEEQSLVNTIAQIKMEKQKSDKKKKKKQRMEDRKQQRRLDTGLDIKGDTLEQTDDINLFDLKKIRNKQEIKAVESDSEANEVGTDDSEDDDEHQLKNRDTYDRHSDKTLESSEGEDSDEEESEEEDEEEEEEMDDDDSDIEEIEDVTSNNKTDCNPLIVDFEGLDAKTKRKADQWFSKDVFQDIRDDADEDIELEEMKRDYQKRGGTISGMESSLKSYRSDEESEGEDKEEAGFTLENGQHDSDSDGSEDSEDRVSEAKNQNRKLSGNKKQRSDEKSASAVLQDNKKRKIVKLNPEELALGEELIKSGKRRKEIIEESYNRYSFNDENLPDWFVKEEAKHMKKPLPVTKERVQLYKERMRAINARPIKKIAEAKARKKMKGMKKLDKARQKAQGITDTDDLSEKEKWSQIKSIYRRAGLLKEKKKETTYVVAKRGAGKKASRPAGVKGHFKVVDPRMKKDMKGERGAKGNNKRQGRKPGKTGRGANKRQGRKR